jgi:hypothetical protein
LVGRNEVAQLVPTSRNAHAAARAAAWHAMLLPRSVGSGSRLKFAAACWAAGGRLCALLFAGGSPERRARARKCRSLKVYRQIQMRLLIVPLVHRGRRLPTSSGAAPRPN